MKKHLEKSTLQFISELQKNNTREWFAEHKSKYEAARKDHIQFLDSLLQEAAKFEPIAAKQQGKDLVFRIYRDIRFSLNKDPFKNHFGAFLAEGGRKSINPGYYLHICPDNKSFIACGLWLPPASPLKVVRQEIDYNLGEFEKVVKDQEFYDYFGELAGEKLKTTPKGYDADNPAITYLRHKSWMVSRPLPDKLVTSDGFLDECIKAIKLSKPLKEFFMRAIREVNGALE
ncbi:DUF2461 domain-containing protein [Adhaeribacter aquaticus]|uniref:DUF2461 domain-containing protein n=1 Tax=Adhaeribacter aquaticus TaxID=299567 RepID=UPI0004264A9D|nr:DUF2461 domain-containing protein [Adhaeribacter aquaticus]